MARPGLVVSALVDQPQSHRDFVAAASSTEFIRRLLVAASHSQPGTVPTGTPCPTARLPDCPTFVVSFMSCQGMPACLTQ